MSPSGGWLSWVAGAYYFTASSGYPFFDVLLNGPVLIPTVPPTNRVRTISTQTTDSLSGFGQATAQLVDGLKATALHWRTRLTISALRAARSPATSTAVGAA